MKQGIDETKVLSDTSVEKSKDKYTWVNTESS